MRTCLNLNNLWHLNKKLRWSLLRDRKHARLVRSCGLWTSASVTLLVVHRCRWVQLGKSARGVRSFMQSPKGRVYNAMVISRYYLSLTQAHTHICIILSTNYVYTLFIILVFCESWHSLALNSHARKTADEKQAHQNVAPTIQMHRFWPCAWVLGSSGSLTWAKLLRKPSTRQRTAEEELFAWVVSGPDIGWDIGCWCSSLVIAHYGSQIVDC